MASTNYNFLFFISTSILLVCCSPISFKPTQDDVGLANKKWTNVTIEQLNAGFKFYTAKCSGCHFLPVPNEYSEKRWLMILPEMSEKSKLSHEEYDLIQKYVITKSYAFTKKK